MKKAPIVIIGSSNTDMVIKSPHLPAPGETILGGTFFMTAGGKGANQAVAAARLGGKVAFIAKLGSDVFGKQALDLFKKERLDISAVTLDKKAASGVALINVDDKGENCIAVASGANANLLPADINRSKALVESASILLMQLETPIATIVQAAKIAAGKNTTVILNPAPACTLPNELYQYISILTPNEHEAGMLTGTTVRNVEDAKKACEILDEKGVATVIITLGAKGALIYHQKRFQQVNAPKVKAVDTTAAGDVFNGALAAALAENKNIKEAVQFACKAASIAVTRLGAQASAPYRKEVK